MAANGPLRERVRELGVEVAVPPMELCTDNAAMIASRGALGRAGAVPGYLDLDAYATGSPRAGVSGRLVLYGRPGCHLCDDAREVLLRVGAPFTEVDIERRRRAARAPSWSAYRWSTLDGEELFEHFVDERT